jgi:hypothetical protein
VPAEQWLGSATVDSNGRLQHEQCADSSRRVRAAPEGAPDSEQCLSGAPRCQKARNQKRKATNPTLQEEELDQEIRDMEIILQQVQRKKEKMARLADLQRKIDEATEEVRHLAQDEQDRRPQHRELRQEGLFNEDGWYDDFNHDTFTFDDASPLAAELQAIP